MIDRSVERVSLCKVAVSEGDSPWIYRIADITNGTLTNVFINEYEPRIFDNRVRLYKRNGPDIDGFFGIWEWAAKPNNSDPEKDFIESYYQEDLIPVEVVEVKEANTYEDIIDSLTDGLSFFPVTRKTLFCTKLQKDSHSGESVYKGILCSANELSIGQGGCHINDEITSLPAYTVNAQDITTYENKRFYRYLEIPESRERILVKEPFDVVKDVLVRRTSWSAVKPLEISKSNWRKIKDFLIEVSASSIYQEVADACHCSEEAARKYVEKFIQNADQYIEQSDYDSTILMEILQGHPELLQKCEVVAIELWKTEHQDEIEKANKELNTIEEQVNNEKKILDEVIRSAEEKKTYIVELTKEIEEKEQLADKVSERVREKICEARRDASSLISEMAFFVNPIKYESSNTNGGSTNITAFREGKDLEIEETDLCDSWQDLVNGLQYELVEAGVEEKYSRSLAAYLYSAYVNNEILLIAGPNGESIARAFAASICGQTPGMLNCADQYSEDITSQIEKSSGDIIVVKNFFNSGWIDHIADLIASKKHYFILHPFVEDLLIEPTSLFSYAIPLVTVPFVERRPTDDYVGSRRSEDFNEFETRGTKPLYNQILETVGINKITKTTIQNILSDFHVILGEENTDFDFCFMVLPYLYVAMRSSRETMEQVIDQMKVSSYVKNDLRSLIGSFEDEV